MLIPLIGFLIFVAQFVQIVVICQFVLYLLLVYNVVSLQNRIVGTIWRGLSAIIDPILAPIRRSMPDTGAIDFSPMVLIFAINIIVWLLSMFA
ncbi:MAG: YggT family protein [Sphingomonadales bacterium]|nr:YggT family protein [Sphingomonadales bacterium]